MPILLSLVLVAAVPAPALSPELQLAVKSLRPGEIASLERAVGPLARQPLYSADLAVDVARHQVEGRVSVSLTVGTQPMDELYLRTTPNAAHAEAVKLASATVNGQVAHIEHPDETLWSIKFPTEFPPESSLVVQVHLRATFPALDPMEDVADHGAFSGSDEFVSLVGLIPMVPPTKRNGDLFSAPSGVGDLGTFAPSSFVVSVTVPKGYSAIMAGMHLGEVPEPSGRVRFAYAIAGAREFPIFIAQGLEKRTASVQDIVIETFATKGASNARALLDHATFAVKQLDRRVGAFPYATFRVVEAPLTRAAGGMEFPGLVTLSRSLVAGASDPFSLLGLDSVNSSLVGPVMPMLQRLLQTSLEFAVMHEVAHQYVACLVGSDAVDEPVADEALTQHLALLLLEWRHGKKFAAEVRKEQVISAYHVWRLSGGRDTAANRPTGDFASSLHYAGIVYGKAPLLYDAQRKLVGDEGWEKSLKAYVEQNRYRWVTAGTLTEVAAKRFPVHADALQGLYRRWFEEQHGDEDLGRVNLGDLLRRSGGSDFALDPQVLRLAEEVLKQLGGE